MRDLHGFRAGILWTDGCCYFSNTDYNGLFKMEVESGKVEFIMFFLNERKLQGSLHKKCVRYKDSILFFPEAAEHVHVFTPKTGKMEAIKIERFLDQTILFSEPVLRENFLFIFPAALGQPITKICLDDYSYTQNWNFARWCKEHVHTDNPVIFGRVVERKGYAWMAVSHSNQIVRINLEKEDDFCIYSLEDVNLFAIFPAKTGFWLVQMDEGTILHWDETINQIKQYPVDEESVCRGRYFNYVLETDFGVYAIPAFAGNVQQLASEEGKFHKVACVPEDLEKRESCPYFYGVECRNNELWFFPFCFYNILVFNMVKNQFRICYMEVKERDYAQEPYVSIFGNNYDNEVIVENSVFNLFDLVDSANGFYAEN